MRYAQAQRLKPGRQVLTKSRKAITIASVRPCEYDPKLIIITSTDGIEYSNREIDPLTKRDTAGTPSTCKMNVVSVNGSSAPECTACGHRFETDSFENPYHAMCRIAMGEYSFCPCCGARYTGCQIEGIDLDKTTPEKRDWILRGNK